MIREFYEGRTVLLTGARFLWPGSSGQDDALSPRYRRIYVPIRVGRTEMGMEVPVDQRLRTLR